jgi:rhamnulokinase
VQARTAGVVGGGLAELRALLHSTQPLRQYEPSGDQAAWSRAAALVENVEGGRAGGQEEEPCA